jgi:hypothetical protein
MTSPSILAEAQHEKSTSQYSNVIPLIPVIALPITTKVSAWIAEIPN